MIGESMAAAGLLGGLSLAGSGMSAGVSAVNTNQAWKRQKKVMKRQIQWRVKDLRKAGLNPVLAAGAGLGGGGAPSVATPMTPDFGQALSSGARAGLEAARNKSVVKNTLAQAGAATAQANAQNAVADRQRVGIETERAQQSQLRAAAESQAANAEATRVNAELMRARMPEAKAIGDLWNGTWTGPIMQFRHMLGGSSVPLPMVNPAPRGVYKPPPGSPPSPRNRTDGPLKPTPGARRLRAIK